MTEWCWPHLPSMGSRAWGWVVAFGCATAIAVAAPASATVLPPTTNPLPGSSFQGADGNQDDAPSLGFIDWQALQAAGRVVHNPDPSAQDSAFTGGSKEDEPGEWGLTTEPGGVNPPKANILDAWSAVDQPGGNTFLYLGFTRQGPDILRHCSGEPRPSSPSS